MSRKDDQELIREVKSNWDYAVSYWREIRSQAETDVLYEEEGPWTQEERDARAGRPTLSLDELTQYLNQLENQARINKRAVKVNPRGNGANDQTARMRGGIIRGIEYMSKAQAAYCGAFGDAVRRSYGYFKLTTDYEPGSNNRIIKILRIPNPDVIYLDPDFKEADASDSQWSFEAERMAEKKFAKRWPKAEVRSFSLDQVEEAPAWISGSPNDLMHIQVAAYCRVETSKKKLVQLEDGSTLDLADVEGAKLVRGAGKSSVDGKPVDMVQMPDGALLRAVEWRDDDDPIVWQYITNGIEILERTELDFTEIPIIPVFGPERWITRGGTSKRTFRSLTRGARDAYKLYCYARSAQCERAGMDPKTPYEGWQGQFNTPTFQGVATGPSNTPTQYVEFAVIQDPATGASVFQQPTKNFQEPAIQQHEILAEAARRAIQAAMGGTPLPTNAQRLNDKSGIALQKIEQSADEGNFHFLDNYERALERAGRMMDAALDVVYDTPNRQVPFNDEEGEHSTLKINPHDEQGNPIQGPQAFHVGKGDHGVTIGTGPSNASQREAAEDFADSLLKTPALLGPTPNKVVALVVKLRNLGQIGDKIAEIIDPQDGPPQIPPALQEHMAKSDQTIQQLTAEVQKLTAGVEIKKYTVDEQEKTKRVLGLLKVNSQEAETALESELGIISAAADRIHQHLLTQADRDHAATQSQADRDHEAQQAEADRQHQADMATQEQEAQQKLATTPPPAQPDLAAAQPAGGTQ